MVSQYIVIMILAPLNFILLTAISILLYKRIRMKNLTNLYFLIIFFMANALQGILSAVVNSAIAGILEVVSRTSLVLFTQKTFFIGKKTQFKLILLSTFLFSLAYVVLGFVKNYSLSTQVIHDFHKLALIGMIHISSVWLVFASFEMVHSLKQKKSISPLIIKRYQLIGTSAIILMLQMVFMILNPLESGSLSVWMITLTVLSLFVFSIISLYVWVILGKRIEFEKQSQEADQDSLSEEDILAMMQEES